MSEKETTKLYNGITGIGEDIIERAQSAKPQRQKKSPVWFKWAAMAACLCLVIVAIAIPTVLHITQTTEPPVNDAPAHFYYKDTLYTFSGEITFLLLEEYIIILDYSPLYGEHDLKPHSYCI